ncbi:MAG TPA: hypothetical protein VFK90_08360 [Anaeromyxobacter sp.]|nr:hypothetical protein [Anaeromyxobacter sp.]
MRPLALVLAAAVASTAGVARGSPSVTLNGVPIDGVTGQKFENCTVVIDAQGNIHIEAKGYAVRGAAPTNGAGAPADPAGGTGKLTASVDPKAAPPAKLTRRYFLATDHGAPGTQYDLAIFINAQWIREVKAVEPQVVMEITKYLRPGPNKVTLVATKRIQGERLSYARDVQLKVVIGEGNIGGDHVMIDVPLVETARTAAEIEDKTEEFVVDAR